jgi:WD40 repeat protein
MSGGLRRVAHRTFFTFVFIAYMESVNDETYRNELIRLIEQACVSLGFAGVAKQLENDSGVKLYGSDLIEDLVHECIEGDWTRAIELLDKLTHDSSPLVPELAMRLDLIEEAKWIILSQKYIESLGDTSAALRILRRDLSPLASGSRIGHGSQANPNNLHLLAALSMFPPQQDQSGKEEKVLARRNWVVDSIQRLFPAPLMLPPNRLQTLLSLSIEAQRSKAPFSKSLDTKLSLLEDINPSGSTVATTSQILTEHTDEVWFIAFSHSGTCLASASKDKTAIIWSVKTGPGTVHISPIHVLSDHLDAVDLISWSPDDRLLLSVSGPTIRLWDVASGGLLHCYSAHKENVGGVAWMPDSSSFFSGGSGKTILHQDINGQEVRLPIKRPTRCQDLCLTSDGKFLIVAGSDRFISLIRLQDMSEVLVAQEGSAITSLTLHTSPRKPKPHLSDSLDYDPLSLLAHPVCVQEDADMFLLVSLQGHEVHLFNLSPIISRWKLDSVPPLDSPICAFSVLDRRPGRWVLRSTFGGGAKAPFVAFGGEDCNGHVFYRDSMDSNTRPFLLLEGHTSTVNCLSWSAHDSRVIASASDDKTIRIWRVTEA